jgi:two-component system, LytTR family, sensor histidine kinase AlgZ
LHARALRYKHRAMTDKNEDASLSVLPERPEPAAPLASAGSATRALDTCHVGLVLRAVLGVQVVLAAGVAFGAADAWAWVLQWALSGLAALPAVMLWLAAVCALKRPLAVQRPWAVYAVTAGLGAVAGMGATAAWQWLEAISGPDGIARSGAPWVAGGMTGGALAFAVVAALVWRHRLQQPAAATARLAELQARIRPHFLFNTLNSAIALIRAEPARAEALLEDLSDLFRHALSEPGASTDLAAELHMAQRYLDIEAVRFGPRLRVHWDIDDAALLARLPPLLLQPLVENAVLHGVEPSADGADVWVQAQSRRRSVVIKVLNTLPGGAGAGGHGMALANVRDRVALLHDVNASTRWGLLPDGRWQVRIEVPHD